MSKKKDRSNTEFRNCPICGSKAIIVSIIKEKHYKYYLECQNCRKETKVEVIRWKEKN